LFDAIHKVQIVGMMAPKHRPPLPKWEFNEWW
jgi:hypothetical protein